MTKYHQLPLPAYGPPKNLLESRLEVLEDIWLKMPGYFGH